MKIETIGNTIVIINDGRCIVLGKNQEIYVNDMVTCFDHYWNSVVPEENPWGSMVDFSFPKVHELKRSHVKFYFPSVAESDDTVDVYLDAMKLSAGDRVLDCGAYSGETAYFFAKAVGETGKVCSFEPDPGSYAALIINTKDIHKLKNVDVYPCAIWTFNGSVSFQCENCLGSSVVSLLGRDSRKSQVSAFSLPYAASLAHGKVTHIKMDIEGAELDVIRSAYDWLKENKPRMVIEPHYRDGVMNTDLVRRILEEIGYHVEEVKQRSEKLCVLLLAYV